MTHNKKRNTVFLYESLIREMTKAVLENDPVKKEEVLKLIKESFKPGTALYQEWASYRALMGIKTSKDVARRVFNKVLDDHKTIPQEQLEREQGRLVKKMNKAFAPTIFTHFLPNYKSMASIYQLFHNKKMPVHKRVLLEEQVIAELSGEVIEESKPYTPISKLAMKTFVERFNNTYSSLLPEQRELLRQYTLSDGRETEWKYFLNEEIGRLKEVVAGSLLLTEVKSDSDMAGRIAGVQVLLESFSQKPIDKNGIESLMRIQRLAAEIAGE